MSGKLPKITRKTVEPDPFSLVVLKKARKQAEEDAKLLANRIALLRLEEQRTAKKNFQAAKKAEEILRTKELNEKKLIEVLIIRCFRTKSFISQTKNTNINNNINNIFFLL